MKIGYANARHIGAMAIAGVVLLHALNGFGCHGQAFGSFLTSLAYFVLPALVVAAIGLFTANPLRAATAAAFFAPWLGARLRHRLRHPVPRRRRVDDLRRGADVGHAVRNRRRVPGGRHHPVASHRSGSASRRPIREALNRPARYGSPHPGRDQVTVGNATGHVVTQLLPEKKRRETTRDTHQDLQSWFAIQAEA